MKTLSPERLTQVVSAVPAPTVSGKYLHWDDLRRRTPPPGLTLEEWWFGLMFRRGSDKYIPLTDAEGQFFGFRIIEPLQAELHKIDLHAGGELASREPPIATSAETKRRYLIRSLMEEAITSSQLEGAATTREVAKEMLRTGRRPRDRDERMILNNYETMQRIVDIQKQPLTKELIFELHRRVTEGTLDNPDAAGRFRQHDEYRVVADDYGEVYHQPPPAGELAARMQAMCDFANSTGEKGFVHPVIRSILLHFWLAYDHPFVDGNGRTARALFYWSVLHHGYRLFEHVSISRAILRAPVQYGMAYLHTERGHNDLNYFILYNMNIINISINSLHDHLKRRTGELADLERTLRGMADLNHRQRDLMRHALRHPGFAYTTESHRSSHGVTPMTARTDLEDLAKRGLLAKGKRGRAAVYRTVRDLEERLREGSSPDEPGPRSSRGQGR